MEASTRSVKLSIQESDVLKLILEFLEKRDFSFSQIALERESGVINGLFNEDILFFRQLILQGHVITINVALILHYLPNCSYIFSRT